MFGGSRLDTSPALPLKVLGYILPESEVLGSFDIEKTYKH